MRLRSLRADLKESKGRIEFPDEIDGDIEVDGLPDKHFRAKRLKHVRLPVIEEDGATKKQKKKMVAKVTLLLISSLLSSYADPGGIQTPPPVQTLPLLKYHT